MATGKTTTDDTVGWQKGPMDRGTVTLIWGCVTTVFACSWTILHLNVPALTDSAWTRILRKTKWMAITIIFPEFILSKAVCDLRLALRELSEFDEYLRSDENDVKWRFSYKVCRGYWRYEGEDEWTWKVDYPRHARWLYRVLFLKPPRESAREGNSTSNEAEREGVELDSLPNNEEVQEQGERNREGEAEEISSPQSPTTLPGQHSVARAGIDGTSNHDRESSSSNMKCSRATSLPPSSMAPRIQRKVQTWTIVHSYFAQMGGLAYTDGKNNYFIVTASQLTLRYEWESFNPHPLNHLILGREDIEDKSKADSFVKSVAVLQIAWLVLNIIARAIKKATYNTDGDSHGRVRSHGNNHLCNQLVEAKGCVPAHSSIASQFGLLKGWS